MKTSNLVLFLLLTFTFYNCKVNQKQSNSIDTTVTIAKKQYEILYSKTIATSDKKDIFPRTVKKEKTVLVSPYDWTSGFFPGSLWYLYKLTNDNKWKTRAILFSESLDSIQYWKGNHDVGFMIECSYGNALKSVKSSTYENIIVQTAKSLSSRFHPKAGIIQSWNSSVKWNCPVIIDNMMNLELLFHATKISKDSTYYKIAISHANQTIKNHFREDFSSYHVLNYDTETGEVLNKNTHQGYADSSSWARGQAWGLYGFTVSYRETKDPKYLQQATEIANYLITHPELPADKIPYWDFDVPKNKNTPRDASAAAIMASALYELSTFVPNKEKEKYVNWANAIFKSLSSSKYLASNGRNNGFLLYHSVGSFPHKVEIDVPLNYADYYFLEALYRKTKLK